MRPSQAVRDLEDKVTEVYQQVRVRATELAAEVEKLVKENRFRRVVIKDAEGKEVVSFTMFLGLVAVLAPFVAVVLAAVALYAGCSIYVETTEPAEPEKER